MLFTIIIFLIVLSLLVFVHELGHFVMAKRAGMKVHEFGFGFPPRLIGIQKIKGKWKIVSQNADPDHTVYSINAIPLGGFVKIMGEDSDEIDDPRSFTSKSFFAKLITLAAGVVMNVILAWLLLSIGFMAGLPVAVQDLSEIPSNGQFTNQQVAIVDIQPGSPAEKSGLQPSDIIQNVDGQTFSQIKDLQLYIHDHHGQQIAFDVKRVNQEKHVTVQALDNPVDGGLVGIGLAAYGKLKFSPPTALVQGAKTTYLQLSNIVQGLYHLFSAGEGLKSLGGPVKIAQLTGQVADLGLIPLLQFSAFLSLNLAILNTLPFPALDGGRMLFLIVEKIRGRKNNPLIEQYANTIGFFVLLLLMAVITVRDISQLQVIKNLFS